MSRRKPAFLRRSGTVAFPTQPTQAYFPEASSDLEARLLPAHVSHSLDTRRTLQPPQMEALRACRAWTRVLH